jgi:hypothetical protein
LKYYIKNILDKAFCSKFNLLIAIPLGKFKLQELEIELSKLKDFDICF